MKTRIFTLDIGNTHPHFGLFENDQLVKVFPIDQIDHFEISSSDTLIFSSVKSHYPTIQITEKFKKIINARDFFRDQHFMSMPIHYSTTLGIDRAVLAHYFFQLGHQASSLSCDTYDCIIDAGTFTTIDFINSSGFAGGYILPGVKLLCDSYIAGDKLPALNPAKLNEFSQKIDSNLQFFNRFPQNTEEAMAMASLGMLSHFLQNCLNELSIKKIHLTGGSRQTFINVIQGLKISSSLVLSEDPHFQHRALFCLCTLLLKDPRQLVGPQ